YANKGSTGGMDFTAAGLSAREYTPGPREAQLQAASALAGSLYDVHSDGSGRIYSSHRRPIFNFRADWRNPRQQAFRHLGADLYLLDWLAHMGVGHNVLTDHLLDEEGSHALAGYRVLVTGSHPEYVSEAILDALRDFLRGGGRIMYLGGNGFYWVTSRLDNVIETRRGNAGTRSWDSPPGEQH